MIEIGTIIHKLREERNISRRTLVKGICSESMLAKLENGERIPELECIDMLIQRMGKSPDKLEVIISNYSYEKMVAYDTIIDHLRRNEYEEALEGIHAFEENYNTPETKKILIDRLYAIWAYQKEEDYLNAEQLLDDVINNLQPDINVDNLAPYSLATIEIENLIMRCHVWLELGKHQLSKQWLEKLQIYIGQYISDNEEKVKLLPKINYLLAKIMFEQGNYSATIQLCEASVELLQSEISALYITKNLTLLSKAYLITGQREKSKECTELVENFEIIYRSYGQDVEWLNVLYFSPCMRQYMLDSTLIKELRENSGLSQFDFMDGVYSDAKSISLLESGKTTIKHSKLIKLLQKNHIDRGRYGLCLVTNDFEAIEKITLLQKLLNRKDYETALQEIDALEAMLDMQDETNDILIDFYKLRIQCRQKQENTNEAIRQIEGYLTTLGVLQNGKLCRRPFPLENSMLVELNLLLRRVGQVDYAYLLLKNILKFYESDGIDERFIFRSISVIRTNMIINCMRTEHKDEAKTNGEELLKKGLELGRMSSVCSSLGNMIVLLSEKSELLKALSHPTYRLCRFYKLDKRAEEMKSRLGF